MHGQRTPSPPSARQQYPSTPTAPYIYTRDLPPSPITPSNRYLAPAPGLRTPYMGTVDLPPPSASCTSPSISTCHHTYSRIDVADGLMTPPSSPEKTRSNGQILPAPCLTREYVHTMAPVLLFNPPPYNPQLARQPATSPPMSTIYIHINHRTFKIMSRSSGHCITIADVLQQLHAEWTRFRAQDDGRVVRSYTRESNTVGDLFADRGLFFAGLTPSRLGPDHFDLHLRS